jgi:Glycosyl hydrolase family 9
VQHARTHITGLCFELKHSKLCRHSAADTISCSVLQVGNLSTESRYWGYPEANTNTRPSYYVPTTIGTSDLTGSMSAAFAAASLAFQNVDKPYAQVLLRDSGGFRVQEHAHVYLRSLLVAPSAP